MGEKLKCMGAYQADPEFRAKKPTKIIRTDANKVECEFLGNKGNCFLYKQPGGMDLIAGIFVGVGPSDLPRPKSPIQCIYLTPSPKISQKG